MRASTSHPATSPCSALSKHRAVGPEVRLGKKIKAADNPCPRTHSNILAWEILEEKSLAGYSPWGRKSWT